MWRSQLLFQEKYHASYALYKMPCVNELVKQIDQSSYHRVL